MFDSAGPFKCVSFQNFHRNPGLCLIPVWCFVDFGWIFLKLYFVTFGFLVSPVWFLADFSWIWCDLCWISDVFLVDSGWFLVVVCLICVGFRMELLCVCVFLVDFLNCLFDSLLIAAGFLVEFLLIFCWFSFLSFRFSLISFWFSLIFNWFHDFLLIFIDFPIVIYQFSWISCWFFADFIDFLIIS